MLRWITFTRSWHVLVRIHRNNRCSSNNRFAAAGRGQFPRRTVPALLCRGRGVGERVGPHSGLCCCGRTPSTRTQSLPRGRLLLQRATPFLAAAGTDRALISRSGRSIPCNHFAQENVRLWPKAAAIGTHPGRQLSGDKLSSTATEHDGRE